MYQPWLGAFLAVLAPLVLNGQTLCDEPPVTLPSWTPGEVALLATGHVSPKLNQTILHYAWFYSCECISDPTPIPVVQPAPPGMPFQVPVSVQACLEDYGQLAPQTLPIQTIIPQVLVGDGTLAVPAGATHMRLRGQIDALGSNALTNQRNFATTAHYEDGSNLPGLAPLQFTPPLMSGVLTQELSPGLVAVQIEHSVTGFFGAAPIGNAVSLTVEFFCGAPPDSGQPECCPPDPGIVAILRDLQLQVALLVARAGPVGELEQLLSTPIANEGQLELELGARMVSIAIDVQGLVVRTVPYANPDRLMRTGTIRFGNDFGWRRREHVDSAACLFVVPADAQVVSWSLSPGTSGRLLQLGEPR